MDSKLTGPETKYNPPPFNDSDRKFFSERGCGFVHYSLWVSNVSADDLGKHTQSYPVLKKTPYRLQHVSTREQIEAFPRISTHHGDKFYNKFHRTEKVISGDYIAIQVGSRNNNYSDFLEARGVIVSGLRLLFGVNAAIEQHYKYVIDLSRNDGIWEDTVEVWAEAVSRLGDPTAIVKSGIDRAAIGPIMLDPVAVTLISDALASRDTRHRFILLWFALESLLGDGNARRKYCEDHLRSERISAEMKRLHKIRGQYAHYGDAEATHTDVYKLLAMLRLVCLRATPAERVYLQFLEATVLE